MSIPIVIWMLKRPEYFFRKIGIRLDGDWDLRRWLYLGAVFLFVYSLYALKKYPEQPYSWPFHHFLPQEGFNSVLRGIFSVTIPASAVVVKP